MDYYELQDQLFAAVKEGNTERVRELLVDVDKNEHDLDEIRDDKGRNLLHYAAKHGHIKMVKLLIDEGVKVDLESYKDRTPLDYAVMYGHEKVARLLIEKGASVNRLEKWSITENDDQMGLMHYAAKHGNIKMVEFLIEKGARVNSESYEKRIPLHYAAREGHIEIVRLLIKKGSNVNALTIDERTPLWYAFREGHKEIAILLIEKGANVNALISGYTPLHYAARSGHIEMAKFLIKRGADVNAKDRYGDTPLDWGYSGNEKSAKKYLTLYALLCNPEQKLTTRNAKLSNF